MTSENNEPRHVAGAGGRVSGAVAAEAKVSHAKPETEPEAVCRDYWAAAKKHYLRGDFPDYASDDWRALEPEDPRRLAGALCFAEMWRKYGDEIASDLHQQLATPEPLWQRATTEACDKAVRQILAQQQRRKEAA